VHETNGRCVRRGSVRNSRDCLYHRISAWPIAEPHLTMVVHRRAVLRMLKNGGYRLPPDPIYSWAIANGWSSRGSERLRLLAADFEAGKRPRLKGGKPFRSDILDVWRREAEHVNS
jgi:hypothetical protein